MKEIEPLRMHFSIHLELSITIKPRRAFCLPLTATMYKPVFGTSKFPPNPLSWSIPPLTTNGIQSQLSSDGMAQE